MNKNAPDTFASRLRVMREAASISAYELARRAGVSKQALSRIEAGLSQPSFATALRLCRALDKSLAEFDSLSEGKE